MGQNGADAGAVGSEGGVSGGSIAQGGGRAAGMGGGRSGSSNGAPGGVGVQGAGQRYGPKAYPRLHAADNFSKSISTETKPSTGFWGAERRGPGPMYLVWGIALPQFNALGRIPDYARMLMLNFGLVSNG